MRRSEKLKEVLVGEWGYGVLLATGIDFTLVDEVRAVLAKPDGTHEILPLQPSEYGATLDAVNTDRAMPMIQENWINQTGIYTLRISARRVNEKLLGTPGYKFEAVEPEVPLSTVWQ